MIIRARVVVTMDGSPIENGAVAISGNQIVDVGTFAEVKSRRSDSVFDVGEQVVFPGLINAHCHLDYTCLRSKIPQQKTFTDWIRSINSEKAKLTLDDYLDSIRDGFCEAKRFGTTTIANLEAFPELIAKIDAPIRTWWFPELIDVREPNRAKQIVDRAVGLARARENWGLAPHAPFTASPDLYRYAVDIATRENVLFSTHLAESEEELQMSRDLDGPLASFLRSIGADLYECSGLTPVAHLLKICRVNSQWIVAHLNSILDGDLESLGGASKCHVVHCPRSHEYFRHSRFRFDRMRKLGFNICLGTDSLASNEDLSLFAEMRSFQRAQPRVAPEEILSMVTVNAALALGKTHVLGRLRTGAAADMVAVPYYGSLENVFEQILAFDGDVSFCAIDGQIGLSSHI